MRRRVERQGDAGGDPKASAALRKMRERMLERFRDPDAVVFARLRFEGTEEYYVGPQRIVGSGDDPVVISWAAPVAKPFFEATPTEPLGLTLRRRFRTKREQLLGIADEWFGTADVEPTIGDILLDELTRERTSEMRQVAATIQRDQYRIIERPLESTTIVQGGPGTGKTVVGLHRAALLLYRHRESLVSRRVLVVGPNRLFMQYIAYVLPSLGETAADQVAVENLVDLTVSAADDRLVARVKGDERMAEVLRRAVVDRVRPPSESINMSANGVTFSVGPEVVAELIGDYDARAASYVDARARFRASLERKIQEEYAREFTRRRPGTLPTPLVLRNLPELDRALDRIWPTITPPELVRQLLASEERIERAASGVLNETEKRLLYRKPVERLDQVSWSLSDPPLVDEVQELIEPAVRVYGHVVLDEAQDLTPMQLRMVGRRIAGGSVTVLGDLAQATGLWSYSSWDEVARHLGVMASAEVKELTHAYRVPREIMELALPVLELTAPSITAPIPFRPGGELPEFVKVDRAGRFEEAVARARAAHERGGTTAVIAPPSRLEELRAAFASSGLEFADAEAGTLSTSVELLDPIGSKGLEFDHVVVLEPAAIIREAEGQGQRDLYVALTRATRAVLRASTPSRYHGRSDLRTSRDVQGLWHPKHLRPRLVLKKSTASLNHRQSPWGRRSWSLGSEASGVIRHLRVRSSLSQQAPLSPKLRRRSLLRRKEGQTALLSSWRRRARLLESRMEMGARPISKTNASAYQTLLRSLGIDTDSYERFTIWCLAEELVAELGRAVQADPDHAEQPLWERPDGLRRFRDIARRQTGQSWSPHDLEALYQRVLLGAEKHERKPIKSGDLLRLLWNAPHECVWCKRRPPEVVLHVDHKFPASKGGSSDFPNLQFLCAEHNLSKGNRFEESELWLDFE
jgi:DNA helicase IV